MHFYLLNIDYFFYRLSPFVIDLGYQITTLCYKQPQMIGISTIFKPSQLRDII